MVTNPEDEREVEVGWWEGGGAPVEARQVADLAKDHSSTEDDVDRSGWWWRYPLFLMIIFVWEYAKSGGLT